MPWWKSPSSRSSSSSTSSSPKKSYRKDLVSFFSHGRDSSAPAGPRLTRQRKLRYLTDAEVTGSAGSTPASRSPSRRESTSSSPPQPQPLPLPEGSGRTPSPGEGEEECSSSASFGASGLVSPPTRFSYQNAHRSSDHIDAPSNISMSSNYRKLIRDPNSVENGNFRPSIPAKSAPTSTFSSPALSPRRLSNVDYMPSHYSPGTRMWSAPELPSNEASTGSFTQTSPDIILHSPNRFSLHSSAKKSPGTRSRNTSAPASPLHPKLYPDSSSTWHESNGNGNVHPLPLPPGAEVPSQSSFTCSNTVKPEECPWQKQKLIGSGTFGNVYVATNRHTGALCAMKEVNIIPDDPKSVECLKQLEQEIKVLSQLKHPNIVQYYGSEIIEDRFYIYLEYVYPGSINKYVQGYCGAMTESVVRSFTRHILRGLAYLHSTKNIHRDIKGANLLVDIKGVVKLADFGMAKHLSGAAGALSLKGTPYWMAPEVVQATMNKDIGYDYAVDIWSLGCTIIEMFTGKHPWNGLEGAAAMFKVLHKDPPIPDTLSSEGKDFLRRCFRRNPADRPTAIMLLDHPFIRNSHHLKVHGSIQAFAGIKLVDNIYSPKDRIKAKSETNVKGKQLSNGLYSDASHLHPESSGSVSSRALTHSMPEVTHNLSPQGNHVSSFTGSSTEVPNGSPLAAGYHQMYALPKRQSHMGRKF
ncbi:mitogen-activated protein kinase kinase kinase 5-like isoform X1 [Iris pallida]|uniref:mitogen-activated protein kinase kinase kinase n=1 Tax=Iris pallida TaxID=29817 RepID=A0AAX6EIN5_IRIPA|nr:mitogen-activated protein kinase kinase kinase 5-like isoform X1 [Iris pallida]